jgi:hypothetical protein
LKILRVIFGKKFFENRSGILPEQAHGNSGRLPERKTERQTAHNVRVNAPDG